MRRLIAVAVAMLCVAAFPVNAGLVTDAAGVLTPAEKASLEARLRAFEHETTAEVAVVTVPSLDGTDIDQYAVRLFAAWGIGKKGKANGVLLLFAPNEPPTGKVRIEVGYGLEPVLTDGVCGEIIRDRIRPGWRSAHRADGIVAGAEAVMERLRVAPVADVVAERPPTAESGWSVGALLVAALVAAVSLAAAAGLVVLGRRRRRTSELADMLLNQRGEWPPSPPRVTASRRSSYAPGPRPAARSRSEPDTPSSYVAAASYDYSSQASSSTPSSSGSDSSSSSSFSYGGGDSGGGGSSSDL